jgi:hypothetical protein
MWLVDNKSALIETSPGRAYTSLRYMSSPNHANTLATYIKQGGRAWLSGGGGAYATLIPWNARNHVAGVWSFELNEVIPGRMMYDLVHWRTHVGSGGATPAITRSARAVGGWSGQGRNLNLIAPDYSLLPASLNKKLVGVDAFPPNRVGQSATSFYQTQTNVEYIPLDGPNFVIEDIDPSVLSVNNQSTLDTLYNVTTSGFPLGPVMTYYHGLENGEMVFSGFPIWWLTRADAKGITDFVLKQIFKQTPSLVARTGPGSNSGSVGPVRKPRE